MQVVDSKRDEVEVLDGDIETLRKTIAAGIAPAALEAARSAQGGPVGSGVQVGGKLSCKRVSEAVELYCTSPAGLPETLMSKTEQGQRRRGFMLFAEFMGDVPLSKIDGDMLRAFRDGPLKTVPANANNLPPQLKKGTMPETIAALRADGRDWPVLRPQMQAERMQWLVRLFTWLHAKDYLAANPAAGLRGETGVTRAEIKAMRREDLGDDARGPFEPGELLAIFTQPTFCTGNGVHVVKGNQRWRPFEFWLPLLGLFAGLRMREACQLWLNDVVERDGIWCLDINESTPDKSLKTADSRRIVPLHPVLVGAGFIEWCDALRETGFQRVMPELTFSVGDAAYGKEPKRAMSAMLEKLGLPRNGKKVYHCLRHNANDALARVSDASGLDEHMRRFVRYTVLGNV